MLALALAASCKKDPDTPPEVGDVVEVRLSSRSVLVDADGSRCTEVVATPVDADGARVDAPVSWTVDGPSVATVDGGRFCGLAAGETRARAAVPGVVSEDVAVVVAPLADAVVPVSDAEVVADTEIVGGGPGLSDLELAFVTRGPAPREGEIVVATGDARILGRVSRTAPVAGGTQVVFEVVPPWEAVDGAFEVGLDVGPPEPADVGDGATVVVDDDGWFTLAPPPGRAAGPRVSCDATIGGAAAQLTVEGAVAVRVPDLGVRLTVNGADDWSVAVTGTLERSLSASVSVDQAVSGSLGCDLVLATVPPRALTGWLSLFVAVQFPVGLSLSLDANTDLEGEICSYDAHVSEPFAFGFTVVEGAFAPCCDVPELPTDRTEGGWSLPEVAIDGAVGVGLFVDTEVTVPLLPGTDATKLLRLQTAVTLDAAWQPVDQQLDAGDFGSGWAVTWASSAGLPSWMTTLPDGLEKFAGDWWELTITAGTSLSLEAPPVELARSPRLRLEDVSFGGTSADFTASPYDDAPLPPLDTQTWWCRADDGWRPGSLVGTDRVVCPGAGNDGLAATDEALGLSFLAGWADGDATWDHDGDCACPSPDACSGSDEPSCTTLFTGDCDDTDRALNVDDRDDDGFATCDGDCDDGNDTVRPDAIEVPLDQVDQDCDGVDVCYADDDEDGWGSGELRPGTTLTCSGPTDSVVDGDCDDGDAESHPGAAELPADARDSDCDGFEDCYQDADGDGWGDPLYVRSVSGVTCLPVVRPGDCDDGAAAVYPGAPEVVVDGVDQSCDGFDACYADADDDGWTVATVVDAGADLDAGLTCATAPGVGPSESNPPDCDDGRASAHPGAAEIPGNGLDDNCDGIVD